MTTVAKLSLRLPPGMMRWQGQAWKRRAENALGNANLQPRGLPPNAILVVRQLKDPQPGALLNGSPIVNRNRWTTAARQEIERMLRRAYRPFAGPVPPDAEAVWFLDQAEWLACFSMDIYTHMEYARWWWQSWLKRYGRENLLFRLWEAEVQALPAALAAIFERNVGSSKVSPSQIARRLSASQAAELRRALARLYSLPVMDGGLPRQIAAPAWREWLPDGVGLPIEALPVEGIGAEVESLLVLALGLVYRPARVRQDLQDSSRRTDGDRIEEVPARSDPNTQPPPGLELTLSEKKPSTAKRAGRPLERARPGEQELPPQSEDMQPDLSARLPAEAGKPAVETTNGASPEYIRSTGVEIPRMEAHAEADRPASLPEEGIFTRLGGVWFLVNLLVGLDLLDAAINPWLLLEALARALLAELEGAVAGDIQVQRDALWQALASLEGLEASPEARHMAEKWAAEQKIGLTAWLAERGLALASSMANRPEPPAGEGPAREAAAEESFLRQPARMFITRTHIDVEFALEDIDLRVRAAGLDRNPGWVAQLGRVILFHFD